MKRLRTTFGCPTELAVEVLGGKWKTVVLARLKDRPLRYGELRRLIPGLSDKVLSAKLRELVVRGLVVHTAAPEPRGGSYRLSEQGERLRPVLGLLYETGLDLAPAMAATFTATGDCP